MLVETMSVRRPTKTVTRTYIYLDEGKFPATVRYVDKRAGVDLKHTARSLAEAAAWVLSCSDPAAAKKTRKRRRR